MFHKWKGRKQFVSQVLEAWGTDTTHINLMYYYIPGRENGFTAVPSRGKKKYTVGLNLCRKAETEDLARFYLCVTLFHELEHIRIEREYQNPCTTMSQWLIAAERSTRKQWIRYFPGGLVEWRQKRRYKRYQTSVNELHCIYAGYRGALQTVGDSLTDAQRDVMERICESVAFVEDNLEVDYAEKGAPVGKFIYLMELLVRSHRKNKLSPGEGLLRLVLFDNWSMKSLTQIFEQRTEENADLIDGVIVQMFMFLKMDFQNELDGNPQLRSHIEGLLKAKMEKLVDYISSYRFAGIYLSEEVLKDNNAMILKEANLLRKLSKKYGLAVPDESILVLK